MTTTKERKDLEPLKTLKFFVDLISMCLKPVMGNYFNQNWTWKWNLSVIQIVVCCAVTAICYSWTGYVNHHDLTEFVFSACLIMIDFLGAQRIIKFVSEHSENQKMIKHILEYVKQWERVEEAFPVLLWYFKLLRRIILSISVMLAVLGFLLSTAPIINFLIFDQMVLAIQCFIPNIDYTTHPGFEIHIVFHAWCTFCTIFALNATTTIVLLLLVQSCIEIDVLRARLNILTGLIYRTNEDEVTEFLKNIFQEHQQVNEFIEACENFLSMQNLSDHFVFGVQTCISLFICLRQFWLIGYILMIAGLVIIFSLDLLGTIIEVKLEKLTFDVYDVPWYLMSLKNQKMFLYFLSNSQNTERFTLGGQIPLCLSTFVQLYKGIYTYLMVLRESLN